MSGPALLPVDEALARILAAAAPLERFEEVALAQAHGRTLARDLAALRTQPPTDVSAMDGYAIRFADFADPAQGARLIGESAAGRPFSGALAAGECARVFTGAATPPGADTILLQEDARAEGDRIFATQAPEPNRHIRRRGLDFSTGAAALAAGTRLGPAQIGLAAAANHARLPVARRPRVALIATGDELVLPGAEAGDDRIVSSNTFMVAAQIEAAGGEAVDFGVVPDDLEATRAAIARARDCDVIVTLGGASVGAHDYVKQALAAQGMKLDFWRLAMRPGKPLLHGTLGAQSVLGLPGNPVSSMVCALLFLQPLIRRLCGDPQAGADRSWPARLGVDLKANDHRQDFLRARLARDADGAWVATPFPLQDSSMLSVLAAADGLLIRAPHAPAARAGEACRILPLPAGPAI